MRDAAMLIGELKIGLYVVKNAILWYFDRNALFWLRMFIFGTMLVYGVSLLNKIV